MVTTAKPVEAVIYAYQVGFGDCFLVRFTYSDGGKKHILIDFGTTGLPEAAASTQLTAIAQDIATKCSGKLDAVVATHRHADHISGFATKTNKKGPGDIIAALKPTVVIQPWTEDPKAARDATAPTALAHASLRGHAKGLQALHQTAQQVLDQLTQQPGSFSPAVAEKIKFIGEDNLANLSAVKNLMTMSKTRIYAYHGGPSGLDTILPGIKAHVLGPPTLKQTDTIRKQKSQDMDEFWQLQLKKLATDDGLLKGTDSLFPGYPAASGGKLPMSVRWFASRLKEARGEQVLEIVRILDRQMNNTSLILLFEAGSKKLLFPGDAQLENWQYALSQKKNLPLLRDVDLYKVGHHGSLNATPKSMWAEFKNRGNASKKGRLKTVMSTMPGKHGSDQSKTEVPRKTLLSALKTESELHSTHLLDPSKLYDEVHIDLK